MHVIKSPESSVGRPLAVPKWQRYSNTWPAESMRGFTIGTVNRHNVDPCVWLPRSIGDDAAQPGSAGEGAGWRRVHAQRQPREPQHRRRLQVRRLYFHCHHGKRPDWFLSRGFSLCHIMPDTVAVCADIAGLSGSAPTVARPTSRRSWQPVLASHCCGSASHIERTVVFLIACHSSQLTAAVAWQLRFVLMITVCEPIPYLLTLTLTLTRTLTLTSRERF